jgi:hypothetical protein
MQPSCLRLACRVTLLVAIMTSMRPAGLSAQTLALSPSSWLRYSPARPAQQTFVPAGFLKVLWYSLELTFYIHVWRVTMQSHTREELRAGPFWPDYVDSVRIPKTWADHDSWAANYVGHALQGGAAARIWLDQREPRPTTASQHWKQLGRAALFTALVSEQFEFGPMSEASIGNVGLRRGRLGWVDHVWTPVGGMLWTWLEDELDERVRIPFERGRPTGVLTNTVRVGLNPSRSLANIGQNRAPWFRSHRAPAR